MPVNSTRTSLIPVAAWLCILAGAAPTHLHAQTTLNAFVTVPREVVIQRLHRLHSKDIERETELKTMFGEAGCTGDGVLEEVVRRKDPPNVICTLPGATPSLIIVGAHLDHVEIGAGAVDDWSGASMLPSLFQSLKDSPRKHTFVFIGFTDEEKGLVGSEYYLKHIPKDQIPQIKAMVNLECLGLGPTEAWAHMANKALLGVLVNVTRSMHAPLAFANVEETGADDDTHPFRDKKVPVITVHSVTQETWRILHSKNDNLAAIDSDDLYESYRVVTKFLATIDQNLR